MAWFVAVHAWQGSSGHSRPCQAQYVKDKDLNVIVQCDCGHGPFQSCELVTSHVCTVRHSCHEPALPVSPCCFDGMPDVTAKRTISSRSHELCCLVRCLLRRTIRLSALASQVCTAVQMRSALAAPDLSADPARQVAEADGADGTADASMSGEESGDEDAGSIDSGADASEDVKGAVRTCALP